MINGGSVEYISAHGNDLAVVNAARVSMGKWKDTMDASDERLIQYLAANKHHSPFRHCSVTMRLRMPVFMARQFVKHRIGVEINEVSGRYVQFDETYHVPTLLRQGSASVKQGSLDTPVDDHATALAVYTASCDTAFYAYKRLLALGVCKEQARMVLPLSLITEMICTMSLQAAAHFYTLRTDSHAQREIQDYAHAIGAIFAAQYPVSWNALLKAM